MQHLLPTFEYGRTWKATASEYGTSEYGDRWNPESAEALSLSPKIAPANLPFPAGAKELPWVVEKQLPRVPLNMG